MMADLTESKCLVIMGKAGSGKDTLALMINELVYGSSTQRLVSLKFSGALKSICCTLFSWDRRRMDELSYKEEELPENKWLYGITYANSTSRQTLRTRRQVLCYVGSEFRSMYEDVWLKAALRHAVKLLPLCDGYISTDCRYPNEQKGLVANFGKVRFVKLYRTGNVVVLDSDHSSENIDQLYTDIEFYVEGGDLGRIREIARLLVHDFFPELVA